MKIVICAIVVCVLTATANAGIVRGTSKAVNVVAVKPVTKVVVKPVAKTVKFVAKKVIW